MCIRLVDFYEPIYHRLLKVEDEGSYDDNDDTHSEKELPIDKGEYPLDKKVKDQSLDDKLGDMIKKAFSDDKLEEMIEKAFRPYPYMKND